MSTVSALQRYETFIQTVDRYAAFMVHRYSAAIACKKGCASCCILKSVFPVEAHKIKEALLRLTPDQKAILFQNMAHKKRRQCLFLDMDGACMVYHARPLICRTHGYPLLLNPLEMTACPKNFKQEPWPPPSEVLAMELVDIGIASINIRYLQEQKKVVDAKRVSFRTLVQSLKEHI